MSRTPAARLENTDTSRSRRPNSFTTIAPDTLKRSFICVFICAFRSICSRAMSPSRSPTRFAGATKTGNTTRDNRVSFHSSAIMATSVVTSTTTFDTTLPRVDVTAFCAPTTSLLRRLVSAPVCVRVKNATGICCTLSNNATRKS